MSRYPSTVQHPPPSDRWDSATVAGVKRAGEGWLASCSREGDRMLLCIDTSFCPGSAPGQMSLYVLECRETAAGAQWTPTLFDLLWIPVSLCECAGAGGCLALVKMTPASTAFLPLTTKLWVVMMQPSPGYRERMPRAHIEKRA